MEAKQIGVLEKEAFLPTVIPGIDCINLSAPVSVQYEISGNCNQNCVFCYNVWKEKNNLLQKTISFEQQQIIINKLIDLEVFEVIFSGGEPLLISKIDKLITTLTEANIRTSLITNGVFLTEQLAIKLKNAGLSGMQISIHASNAGLHDSITAIRDSFYQTITGIKNAIKIFSPETINVNMVLIDQNYQEVEPLIKLLSDMGAVQFSMGFLSKTGKALSENLYAKREQILRAFHTMIKVGKERNLEVGISGGFPICLFPQEEQEQVINLSANICDAGLNQLVISSTGDIRACVCLPQVLGNILKDDPRKIWRDSSFLQSLRRFEHVPKQCYRCDLVSLCKGGCRAAAYCVYGNFEKIDPIIETQGEIKCQEKHISFATLV